MNPHGDISNLTLGERYGMELDDYIATEIPSVGLSVRVTNALMRNKITTVAQLLGMTMEQLRGMRNFGRLCEEELDTKLPTLCTSNTNRQVSKLNAFSLEEKLRMASGDFAFLAVSDLSNEDIDYIAKCIEAQDMLGKELAYSCINTPAAIASILEMVSDFGRRAAWQEELGLILNDIPEHRKNNQAIAYINTYTRLEEERKALIELYPSATSPLKAIVNYDNYDAVSVRLAKQFLTWCKYDLKTEIAQLFSTLYPNERNQKVVQLRAQKKTLEQIGGQFGLTRERIRQIENKIQRLFNRKQSYIKIISKINADKNNTAIVTASDLAEYCTDHLQELIFLLCGCESSNFTYNKGLDVFVVGDDSLQERACAFVEKLPDIIPIKKIPQFYHEAEEEYGLSGEMVDKAIAEAYKLTGDVYHRVALSLANIYTEIIGEYYPTGIDAYDPATIAQFRQYIFDKYGSVKLPENDRALSARIAGICILCGRGRYRLKQKQYIPNELAQRICEYIEESDMTIFMTNTVFAVFEDDLRRYGVDNKYYLQGILHELFGEKFTFTRDYISKDPSITSIYPSIVNLIWCSKYPVTKEQILERYPGLPEIAINIATSDPEVLVYYGGAFFHVESLKITDDEKEYLDLVMRRVVADGGIHHTKEIYAVVNAEKPEIFKRNGALYPFSAGSILEHLFQNRYEFARPFVAQKGVDISSPSDRLHEFVNQHTVVTVTQISEFIRSSKINVPSHLDLIDECNDRFLLTDAETLQTIENTGVDSETARRIEDMVLAELVETIRIKDLRCWGQLPTIKVPWTDWLVYSVLKKWGDKVDVAPSYSQFRYAVPLVAPKGKMDTTQYSEAIKTGAEQVRATAAVIDDLDCIDELIADLINLEEWRDEGEF